MLHLDASASFAKALTPSLGITDQDFTAMRTTMKRYVQEWMQERSAGQHAWAMDPYHQRVIDQVEEVAKRIKSKRVQTVLWIGIGGSGLGPRVIQEVFETPETVEFLVVDTIDPALLQLYLRVIDWKRAFVVVASKSGETLETMSAFFLFWEELKRAHGNAASEFALAITDPQSGFLRNFCLDRDIAMLPIARDVGGRYSIFSPVGLLPLALLSQDGLAPFLRGAREMDVLTQNATLEDNPAAMLATVQFLLETKRGYPLRVIMPYGQRLQSFARWNQQLIAESLGKTELHNPFPVAAIGTQDQHSLLQQWLAGPRKAWHLFIRELEKPKVYVPQDTTDLGEEFRPIAGRTFGQLLDACEEGTSRALTQAKRPHATVSLTRLDGSHLGSLFFCFLAEVVFLGKLYRIDPYGQPAVEIGKKFTKELLSRSLQE